MQKNLSKVLSLLLSLCMLFAVAAVPAMAEGEAAITGIGTIIAPPKGVLAAIPAGLVNADGTAVASPTLSIGDGASGVYKSAQNLIVDGDAVSGGSFALTAAGGETTATQNVAVSDILYYEDFEDVTVPTAEGEYVYTSSSYLNKLDGTTSTTSIGTDTATTVLKCTTTNKQYASNSGITIPLSSFTSTPAIYTIEATVRNPGYTALGFINRTPANTTIQLQDRENKQAALYWYEYDHTNKNQLLLATINNASAAYTEGNTSWVSIKLVIDFINGKIVYYEGGSLKSERSFENMKGMPTSDIKLAWEVDEILVYSGTSYTSALGSITGPSTVTAPENGKYTKQPAYKLLNAGGSAVENATIFLAKSNPCMKIMNNSLVVSNVNVNTTPNYLIGTDSNGDFIAKKEIRIENVKYFEDFEEEAETANLTSLPTIDGTASGKSIASTTNEIKSEGEGETLNRYSSENLKLNLADLTGDEKYIRVAYKYKWSGSASDYFITFNTGGYTIPVRFYTAGGPYVVCSSESGVSPATATRYSSGSGDAKSTVAFAGKVSADEWKNVALEFDFETGAFTVTIDNRTSTNYFTDFTGSYGLEELTITGGYVDDVSITTGKDFYIAQPEMRLNIPAAGKETTAVTAAYSDGTPAVITSITEDYDGIETSGADVTVSSNADVTAYTLTLSDGFVTSDVTVQSDKDYVLLNGAAVDENTTLGQGSNTVKAAYGASDLKSGRQVIIAHFGNDKTMKDVVTGTQTGNVIEATLTEDVISGDVIKVFTWIMNTLVPIKSVTID